MISPGGQQQEIVVSHSVAETRAIGRMLGSKLPPNSVVCFFGDLGAGKTTFIQGLAAGVLDKADVVVSSPTFTYLNIYRGIKTLYHFDLYRLRDADEFLSMGFDEVFDAGGICCIEWAEKISMLLPEGVLCVRMSHLDEHSRSINIRGGNHG